MTPAIEDGPVTVYHGHVLEVLREMPPESVHMICTSPPFYGLRDYGTTPQVWGSAPNCEHEWATAGSGSTNHVDKRRWAHAVNGRGEEQPDEKHPGPAVEVSQGDTCIRCGAWLGNLGLEPLPDCQAWARGEPPCSRCWVCHLRVIAAELWRVLRPDGTFWMELGDSYASGAGAVGEHPGGGEQGQRWKSGGRGDRPESPLHATGAMGPMTQPNRMRLPGLKPKDLIGGPWRVALALQADGWYLRSDIIWSKPNPMPESVADRPTKSHEYLFLLAKSRRYYFDAEAVKEGAAYVGPNGVQHSPYGQGFTRRSQAGQDRNGAAQIKGGDRYTGFNSRWDAARAVEEPTLSRNCRSVWTVATQPYAAAHFATFPDELVLSCIAAGSSEHGVCPECGAPWRRVVERTGHVNGREPAHQPGNTPTKTDSTGWAPTRRATSEWQPTCAHNAPPIPATVLDPFAGSGTTLAVARRMGRKGIGIELQAEYLSLIQDRIERAALPLIEEASAPDEETEAVQESLFEAS